MKWFLVLSFIAGVFVVLGTTSLFLFAILHLHYPVVKLWKLLAAIAFFAWTTYQMWKAIGGNNAAPEAEDADSSGPTVPPYGV